MSSDELKKQRELSNNLAKLIVDFAGDMKKPVINMAECLDRSNKTLADDPLILSEIARDVKSVNDLLNKFVGYATNLYLSAHPPQ